MLSLNVGQSPQEKSRVGEFIMCHILVRGNVQVGTYAFFSQRKNHGKELYSFTSLTPKNANIREISAESTDLNTAGSGKAKCK